MRYRLRTLMMVLAVAPPALALCWWVGTMEGIGAFALGSVAVLGAVAFYFFATVLASAGTIKVLEDPPKLRAGSLGCDGRPHALYC
jgi:hypothetical protein